MSGRARTLLTLGTFDVPHVGHAAFLRACEAYADRVVVAVNTDEFVASFKAPPLYRYAERAALIAELGYQVVANPTAGRATIEKVKPNIIAIGSDWMRRDYLSQIDVTVDFLETQRIALLYLPYTPGISSSAIKRRAAA